MAGYWPSSFLHVYGPRQSLDNSSCIKIIILTNKGSRKAAKILFCHIRWAYMYYEGHFDKFCQLKTTKRFFDFVAPFHLAQRNDQSS